MQFDDRDILTDLLLDIKAISTNYHNAVLESAHDRVRNTLIQLNNDKINLHRQIFNLMQDRNWYQTGRQATGAGNWRTMSASGGTAVGEDQYPY